MKKSKQRVKDLLTSPIIEIRKCKFAQFQWKNKKDMRLMMVELHTLMSTNSNDFKQRAPSSKRSHPNTAMRSYTNDNELFFHGTKIE